MTIRKLVAALKCRSCKKGRYALEADFGASLNGCNPPVADTVHSAQCSVMKSRCANVI
jgi:hypothetical protein